MSIVKKLTSEESITEYCKCVVDPVYAIENYISTHDLTTKQYVPFVLFEKQKELVLSYENFSETIATKSRQAGVTTTTAAYFAVKMMLASKNNPERMVIITNKLEGSKKILAQVTEFIMQLSKHPFFFIDIENPKTSSTPPDKVFSTKSKTEVFLEHNGSSVKAISSGRDASRGLTSSFLLFDEAAFIENGIDIYTSALPLISTGGKCSLVSTANGKDPLYFCIYQGVLNGTNNFNLVEMRWYMDPRFNTDLQWIKDDEIIDEKDFTLQSYKKKIDDDYKPTSTWYRDMCRKQNGNLRAIAQEIDVDFLNSGGNVVSSVGQKLQREKNMIEKPVFEDPENKDVWVWKTPEEVIGHRLIMSVDPASGSGADNSSIEIIDVDYIDENGEPGVDQIFEYYGKFKPDELGELAYKYAQIYDCFVIIDCIGGWGYSIAKLFMNNKYKKLYYDSLANPTALLTNNGSFNALKSQNGKPAGFHNPAHRPNMCNRLAAAIENNLIKLRSIRTINELETWIWNNNRVDHARNSHDDALMALAMALFVYENAFNSLKISASAMAANLAVFSGGSYSSVRGLNTKQENIGKEGEKTQENKIISPIFGGSYGSSKFMNPNRNNRSTTGTDADWLIKRK